MHPPWARSTSWPARRGRREIHGHLAPQITALGKQLHVSAAVGPREEARLSLHQSTYQVSSSQGCFTVKPGTPETVTTNIVRHLVTREGDLLQPHSLLWGSVFMPVFIFQKRKRRLSKGKKVWTDLDFSVQTQYVCFRLLFLQVWSSMAASPTLGAS